LYFTTTVANIQYNHEKKKEKKRKKEKEKKKKTLNYLTTNARQ